MREMEAELARARCVIRLLLRFRCGAAAHAADRARALREYTAAASVEARLEACREAADGAERRARRAEAMAMSAERRAGDAARMAVAEAARSKDRMADADSRVRSKGRLGGHIQTASSSFGAMNSVVQQPDGSSRLVRPRYWTQRPCVFSPT